MEKYIKYTEAASVLKLMLQEPREQHKEDWHTGVYDAMTKVCTLPAIEAEETKECTKGLHLGHNYYCSNCEQLAPMYNYCAYCGAKVKE